MASVPTAEGSARRILDTFLDFGCRPGYVLSTSNFFHVFTKAPWQTSDLAIGMSRAIEEGWVEDLGNNRFKLTESGYSEAGEEPFVNLFSQCNEVVTVERQSGSRQENVQALVTDKMIMIPDASVAIAPDDVVLRKLPSGLVERLVVTDPGFKAAFHALPAHYQVRYRREGQDREGKPGYVVHVAGDNARVNIGSTDNSINTVNSIGCSADNLQQLAEELATLRTHLLKDALDADRSVAVGAIASAEIAAKEGDSSKVAMALSALGKAGLWVLGVAKEIGVSLAAEVLKRSVLPPA